MPQMKETILLWVVWSIHLFCADIIAQRMSRSRDGLGFEGYPAKSAPFNIGFFGFSRQVCQSIIYTIDLLYGGL